MCFSPSRARGVAQRDLGGGEPERAHRRDEQPQAHVALLGDVVLATSDRRDRATATLAIIRAVLDKKQNRSESRTESQVVTN